MEQVANVFELRATDEMLVHWLVGLLGMFVEPFFKTTFCLAYGGVTTFGALHEVDDSFGPPEGNGPIRYPLSVCMSVCL